MARGFQGKQDGPDLRSLSQCGKTGTLGVRRMLECGKLSPLLQCPKDPASANLQLNFSNLIVAPPSRGFAATKRLLPSTAKHPSDFQELLGTSNHSTLVDYVLVITRKTLRRTFCLAICRALTCISCRCTSAHAVAATSPRCSNAFFLRAT